ncbi:hypothetical protein J3Q64DRAFT_1695240 [Phycomyces blakesleeanus]|uniref:Transposase Helix-turn-helix domain-containing protein n=1 Tax=Phycomyces blakesleeanus TaxID=4837 RepID=A0ABR3BBL2_PHYBL
MPEIKSITMVLGLESTCHISKIRVSNIFGFAMLMYQYSSPKRLFGMSLIFGMDPTSISAVLRGIEDMIYEKIRWGIQFNTHLFLGGFLDVCISLWWNILNKKELRI